MNRMLLEWGFNPDEVSEVEHLNDVHYIVHFTDGFQIEIFSFLGVKVAESKAYREV